MAPPDVHPDKRESPLAELLSAEDLQRLVARHEVEQMEQQAHARTAATEERRARVEMLKQRRELTPEIVQRAVTRWQTAASQGAFEIELIRFPSDLCTDDGRAINSGDSDWPQSLVGVPAQIYEIWADKLKSRGFKLRAYVVDFPGGKPGDIGMFLSWS